VVLGLLSEILGRAGIVHRDFLPPASTILGRAVSLAGDGYFLTNLWSTIKAWAIGLAVCPSACCWAAFPC
jgi:NitT/TauT family transport system permease protein